MTLALVLFLVPLAFSPGPGNLFFAAIGARHGLRASIPASVGYHGATLLMAVAIGFGFAAMARHGTLVFEALRLVGAAYIFWMAWGLLRAGAVNTAVEAGKASVLDGAVLLLVNPKAYMIVASMFTQFLPVAGTPEPALVLWIALVFTLNNLVAFTIWTLGGELLMRRFRSASRARLLNVGLGGLLAGVGVWMLLR